MKQIKFESNYSTFSYRLTAEIGEDCTAATEALCMEGLANISYRVAGSAVDKALGVKSKKNGGMGREGVSFDPKHIPTIESAVSTKITELENAEGSLLKPLGLSFAVTGEYVPKTDGTSSKEATELWTKVQGLEEEKFKAAMVKLGFKLVPVEEGEGTMVEAYTDEDGIAACVKHIQAEKAAAKARAAAGLGL